MVAKFLVAYLPTLALGVIFMVAVSILQKASLVIFLYGLLATAMCQAGMNGILLAFGVAGANFNWTDPRRMNAGVHRLPGSGPDCALPADLVRYVHRSAAVGFDF